MPEKLPVLIASQPLPERVRALGDFAFGTPAWQKKAMRFLSTCRPMAMNVVYPAVLSWLGITRLIAGETDWGAFFVVCAIGSMCMANVRLSADMAKLGEEIADLRTELRKRG